MSEIIKGWLAAITLFILVFIGSCAKENFKDHWPPDEVKFLKAEPGDGFILLTWEDPENSDFGKVEIGYKDTLFFVPKGLEEKLVNNLHNDSMYRFTVRTIDINGNKSFGRHAHAKPVASPVITWLNAPETVMDTSYLGELTGGFATIRNLRCTEGEGLIRFRMNTIRLEDSAIVLTGEKQFMVYEDFTYRMELVANGDITILNCTDCQTGQALTTLEVTSLSDGETFTIAPASCIEIPLCGNGKNKKETRWNMISVDYLNLYKTEVEK